MNQFEVLSVNVSTEVGVKKAPVDRVRLRPDHGIDGDAHARNWHRQVSLLAQEDIDTMKADGLELSPGDFAENITTRGVALASLPIGSRLRVGEAELEVTQIGKDCHAHCTIYHQVGRCVMPTHGIFARVVRGGFVCSGDRGSVEGP